MFADLALSVISPLGSALLGFITAIVLRCIGRAKLAGLLQLFSVLWLYAWSTPWLVGKLSYAIEWQHPPKSLNEIPHADAIVVLGGGVGASGLAIPHLVANLSPSADRMIYAAHLYHAGKAPKLLLAGGSPLDVGHNVAEAELMRQLLRQLGVPNTDLVLESQSRTTQENAAHSQEIIMENGWQELLLVTSARHMGRALGHYQAEQYRLHPAPAEYDALMLLAKPCCIPSSSALAVSAQLFKEVVGQALQR